MSKQLTMDKVLENLQRTLHDLHDLSLFADNMAFRGIIIDPLGFTYRDEPRSYWTIEIRPSGMTKANLDAEVDNGEAVVDDIAV